MTTTRIRVEFDIEVHDEEAARATAQAFIVEQVEREMRQGGTLEMGKPTVEESAAAVIDEPAKLASILALTVVARGGMQIPEISVLNAGSTVPES